MFLTRVFYMHHTWWPIMIDDGSTFSVLMAVPVDDGINMDKHGTIGIGTSLASDEHHLGFC